MKKINLNEKFNLFSEHWTPKIIGDLNDSHVKLAKFKGEFVWHKHEDEDELFLVVKGNLVIKFRTEEIHLSEGELIIIPKGVEHLPVAKEEAHVMLIELKSTRNTGSTESKLTVENPDRT